MKSITLAAISLVLATQAATAQVVINEIYTGDPDYVEIANVGQTVENISGWKLATAMNLTNYPVYTIPNGVVLAPGQCAVLLEGTQTTLPASSPALPAGAVLIHTGLALGWVGTSTGCAALADTTGLCRDFVVFGTGAVAQPAIAYAMVFTNPIDRSSNSATLSDAIYRINTTDTDSGYDWTNGVDGDETPGSLNPGQSALAAAIKRLVLAPATMNFDASNQTFSMQATITACELVNGANALDALVGGSLNFSGTYFGQDVQTLGGLFFTPATLTIATADGQSSATLTTIFQADASLEWSLGGGLGALPLATRAVTTVAAVQPQAVGQGSQILNAIVSQLAQGQASLVFATGAAGATATAFEIDHTAAPALFAAAIATNGQSAVEVGVVNAQNCEIWNVFAVDSTIALGTGSLFGLEFGAIQFAMIVAPLGTQPFHVAASAAGTYQFTLPATPIPAGTVIDHVAVGFDGQNVFSSQAQRLTF